MPKRSSDFLETNFSVASKAAEIVAVDNEWKLRCNVNKKATIAGQAAKRRRSLDKNKKSRMEALQSKIYTIEKIRNR